MFNDCWIVLLNCQNLEGESALFAEFVNQHENVIEIRYNEYIKLYSSWNDGIKNTDSEYIVNYNMDDQWHPEYLETCTKWLNENQDHAIVSSGCYVACNPNQVWPNWKWIDKMPFYKYPLSTAGPCPVWRRVLHDKYGYFEDHYVISDAKFWEQLYTGNEKFGLIDSFMVLYYQNPESLERRCDPKTGQPLITIDKTDKNRAKQKIIK